MTPGGGGLGSVFHAFARPGEEHAEQARASARQVSNALARRNDRDRTKHGSAALSGSIRTADAGSTAIAARIRTLALRAGAAREPPPPPPPPARLAPPARPALSLKQAPKCPAIFPAQRCSPRAGRSPRTPCSSTRRGSLVFPLWGDESLPVVGRRDCVSPLCGFGVVE